MNRFTIEEDKLHSERIRNAKKNPATIDEVLDNHLFNGPCRLTEIERRYVMNAMDHWMRLNNKMKRASGSQKADRGINDLTTGQGKRNANKLPPFLFTKEELQSVSDLLWAAIVDGRGDQVIEFFNTDHKSDVLLKLIKD